MLLKLVSIQEQVGLVGPEDPHGRFQGVDPYSVRSLAGNNSTGAARP